MGRSVGPLWTTPHDVTSLGPGGFTWCHKISNRDIMSPVIWLLHLNSFHVCMYFRKLLQLWASMWFFRGPSVLAVPPHIPFFISSHSLVNPPVLVSLLSFITQTLFPLLFTSSSEIFSCLVLTNILPLIYSCFFKEHNCVYFHICFLHNGFSYCHRWVTWFESAPSKFLSNLHIKF